jgi:sulfur transfer complex TusBCD TusB component (DsrH family)
MAVSIKNRQVVVLGLKKDLAARGWGMGET